MKPLVSVILPVYNAEFFLEEALQSVFDQNYNAIEIIAINDGSTDGSFEILKKYERDIIIIDQENMGVAKARNNGIQAAQGLYVAFLDNDDIFLPGKINAQVTYLEKHPKLQMCVPLCEGFLEKKMEKPSWVRDGFLDVGHRNLSPSAWLMRKEIFSDIGLFDSSYTLSSDSDWIARFVKAGYKMGVIEKVLWQKRVHEKNASGINNARQYNQELISFIAKKIR